MDCAVGTRPQHGAVLEIDIDTFRARCGKAGGEIGRPIVNAGIKAEFLNHVLAFIWSPPAMPTARAPLIRAIWPTTEPTAPETAPTATVIGFNLKEAVCSGP